MANIVILEAHHTNPGDLSWDAINRLGEVTIYQRTTQDQLVERALNADILITNKLKITWDVLSRLPRLKLIHQLATGTDNIDKTAAAESGVIVMNAVGYSTNAVAQHVFALVLELSSLVSIHNDEVQKGGWNRSGDWCHMVQTPIELSGKTLGIIGFGQIGQAVAQLGMAFGMDIKAVSKHASEDKYPGISIVSIDELTETSDVITIHSPLTPENKGMIDSRFLNKMKKSSLLINTARGGHVNEVDLRETLVNHKIAGAALDVLINEPPEADHPLIGVKNCIITPHIAWTAFESRRRLIDIVANNISKFLAANPI
ncbi:MAG: glycerate dehydrogenase [Cyclobacteriaceae bacterium]|jgi:glycerate dehydrogenase